MKKFTLLGYPLGHSLSPFIQSELFKIKGMAAEYGLLELPAERLSKEAFLGLDGFNVTIPHKLNIIPFLDKLSERAGTLGCVNTVKCDGEMLFGYNTDYDGFLGALKLNGIELAGRAAIAGCGGTARMMCHAVAAYGCEIFLIVRPRSVDRANALADELKGKYPGLKIKVGLPQSCDILLNATPAGMYPHPGDTAVPEQLIKNSDAVFDAVYNPSRTKLLQIADDVGVKTASGLAMLVLQAAEAQKIWIGSEFSDGEIHDVISKAAEELERIF